jgi:hypothetical protein
VSASKLTPEQKRAVGALLIAPSVEAAAKLAGVSVEDQRAWMKSPHFQQAYQEAAAEVNAAIPAGPPYCHCRIRLVEQDADEPDAPSLPMCLECGRPREPGVISVIVLIRPSRAADAALIDQ